MLKPEEIYNEQFELSVLGGYKREQVDNFFSEVASGYEKLYKENAELLQKLKVCVDKIEEYQKDEKFLKAAIINAEKLNETSQRDLERREQEIETSAKEKASIIVEKAQLEADNIIKSARLEANDMLRKSEDDAILKISELKKAQENEESVLNGLKKEVSDFKEMILKLYKEHLNSLTKLPEYEPKNDCELSEEFNEEEAAEDITDKECESESEPESEDEVVSDKEEEEIEVVQENKAEETSASGNEKTAEFVIEKNPMPIKPKEDVFERNFKFKDLKFGTDFDVKKEK